MSTTNSSPATLSNRPELTPAPTPPTMHMVTDSRANKRTRPTTPTPDDTPQPCESIPDIAPDTPNPPSTNKRRNLEQPAQQPANNQWQYLQSDSSTTEVSGMRYP